MWLRRRTQQMNDDQVSNLVGSIVSHVKVPHQNSEYHDHAGVAATVAVTAVSTVASVTLGTINGYYFVKDTLPDAWGALKRFKQAYED